MKVIMVGSHPRVTGGITRVVKNYIEAGLGDKVNLTYLPTYYGSNHIINILYFIIQIIKLFTKLFILNQTFEVAHIHMSYRGSFIRKRLIINLFNKKNIPILLHMHGSQFKDFYKESSEPKKQQIIETLNKANIILALGKQWKDYYEDLSTAQVVSLDNAVFPKDISNNLDEKIYITTMGLLSHRKGTYDIIDAALKIQGKIDKKYKFLIAGDGEIEKVKKKITELNLQDMFIVPGWVSNQEKIEEIYRKSIIYLLPSYNEGMPMSILEAMSYGLPVISTDVGSISSVVKKENGFLIKPGDTESLVELIIYILNNNIIINTISKENTTKIKQKYNIYTSIELIYSLYCSVKK